MAEKKKTDVDTDDGFVIPEGTFSSSAPQNFPGFPGIWQDGVPIALSDLGLFDKEAAADLVAELGLPLEAAADIEVLGFEEIHGYADPDFKVPPPGGTNDSTVHIGEGGEVIDPNEPPPTADDVVKGATRDELLAEADKLGVEVPDSATKAEIAQALIDAGFSPSSDNGEGEKP